MFTGVGEQKGNLCPCGSGKTHADCCFLRGGYDKAPRDQNPRVPALNNIISDLEAELKWDLPYKKARKLIAPSPDEITECNSDAVNHAHYIGYPPLNSGKYYLQNYTGYIHELIHAKYCEQIHSLFSGMRYVKGTPHNISTLCFPFIDFSLNWFVDAKVAFLCPGEFSFYLFCLEQRVKAHEFAKVETLLADVAFLVRKLKYGVIDAFVRIAWRIALIKKWSNRNTFNIQVPGLLQEMVETFLSVHPEDPTIEKLTGLINRLLVIFFPFEMQLRIVSEDHLNLFEKKYVAIDVWQVDYNIPTSITQFWQDI